MLGESCAWFDPALTVAVLSGVFLVSLVIYPFLGLAFFPSTDAGQFTINLKVPTGTRLEVTEQYVAKVEDLIRNVVGSKDLKMVVSNIGVVPDFSSLYTTNAGPYTATIQVALQDDHHLSSFEYMDRVQKEMASQYPDIRTFFSSGSMVDAILNSGMPAPIDVQVSSRSLKQIVWRRPGSGESHSATARRGRGLHSAGHELSGTAAERGPRACRRTGADAERSGRQRHHRAQFQLDDRSELLGRSEERQRLFPHGAVFREWPGGDSQLCRSDEHPDPRPQSEAAHHAGCGGEAGRHPDSDRSRSLPDSARHRCVCNSGRRRPGQSSLTKCSGQSNDTKLPENVRVDLRGMVKGMNASFRSFAIGLSLSVILLYLILVAQFKSFKDPLLIMLAIPMGFIGVLIILPLTGTTLNVMSLMGVLMLVGISASNSILIVEFAHRLEDQGSSVKDAIVTSCRVRLRPILMTSLATIIGMVPMALKLGTGSEQYAPLARAIIGGLTSSVVLTIFIVPAAYLLVYGKKSQEQTSKSIA